MILTIPINKIVIEIKISGFYSEKEKKIYFFTINKSIIYVVTQ